MTQQDQPLLGGLVSRSQESLEKRRSLFTLSLVGKALKRLESPAASTGLAASVPPEEASRPNIVEFELLACGVPSPLGPLSW